MSEPLDPLTFGRTQRCFGCGPEHPTGLRMRFERDGELVRTRFVPTHQQEGPPGILHGGLQATLADELGAWTLIGLRQRWGFTSTIDVRLLRPARVGVELLGTGRILKEGEKLTVVGVSFEQHGKATLKGRLSFVLPTVEEAERILGQSLPEAWRRFGGG